METGFLKIEELAEYLNIKVKTLYAMTASTDIPHYRIGKLIRFSKEEIDEWLKSCKNGNKPEAGQHKIKTNRKKSSTLFNNHVDKITRNIIEKETNKYYSTDNGKSDRIEAQEKETNNGSI
jgi:excisionase family DNA binding protein